MGRKNMKVEQCLDWKMIMRKLFYLCVDNKGYEVSLIPRKLYNGIPNDPTEQDGLLRVIDESGDDYLYNKSHFIPLVLPEVVERILEFVD